MFCAIVIQKKCPAGFPSVDAGCNGVVCTCVCMYWQRPVFLVPGISTPWSRQLVNAVITVSCCIPINIRL